MKTTRLTLLLAATFALALSASARLTIPAGAAWVAWKVPMSGHASICCNYDRGGRGCCDCDLESHGFSTRDDVASSGTMTVVAKMNGATVERLRLVDGDCPVQRAGLQWLSPTPEESIDFLAEQVERDGSDRSSMLAAIAMHDSPAAEPRLEALSGAKYTNRIREDALFWIGQQGGDRGARFLTDFIRDGDNGSLQKRAVFSLSESKGVGATEALIDFARHHPRSDVRRESLFWLGQKAGAKAAAELRRAVDEDPDDSVREQAVFAISQLPADRSVPLLIDLVKKNKSRKVRERAMFWLAQTNDPRALSLIEQILVAK
ncbi:MAG: HEAT repeat domain-containing protein [Acidobacteria bacterium]|nr:HEAT repeat domain-containing protein [Acidobacteriota bacterium]MBV9476351.1 HEAT repeat domain-containing protein [Acidobacteriota bacterium]